MRKSVVFVKGMLCLALILIGLNNTLYAGNNNPTDPNTTTTETVNKTATENLKAVAKEKQQVPKNQVLEIEHDKDDANKRDAVLEIEHNKKYVAPKCTKKPIKVLEIEHDK